MISRCKSCGRTVVWLKTLRGKSVPVDADSVEFGERLFNYKKHVSHWAVCTHESRRGIKDEKYDQAAHNLD